jgi:ribose 5-phosphate isomerase B
MPKIYFASDHAGFVLKRVLVEHLKGLGYEIEDLGAHEFEPEDDFPDFITPLAHKIAENPDARGIVLGGSGEGEAMCANRVVGVRAVVFYGEPLRPQTDSSGERLDLVTSTRSHNDANVLSLGARFLTEEEAKRAATEWLTAPFSSAPRHTRRLAKF